MNRTMIKPALHSPWENFLKLLFISTPYIILAFMAFTWLHLGIDLPFYDDWRDYISGTIASFSPHYLFGPANDTMYPVGKFLDAVAQRALGGNSIAYQFISMISVLGLILWLQWKLLEEVFEDRFLAACCFVPTVLSLQIGTYWGFQNLAYHQAIPLVCMLASLNVIVRSNWPVAVQLPILFLLGLISGFSYISGAFTLLAGSLVLLGFGLLTPGRIPVALAGGALAVAGVITSAMQAHVIIVGQQGQTHRADAPWGSPLSSEFWLYVLGKIAQSLDLPANWPVTSLVVTLAVTVGAAALLCWQLFKMPGAREAAERQTNRLLVTGFLVAVVAVYLAMIAAGRVNLRSQPFDSALDAFVSGFHRFHFFWVTLLWPWVAAAALMALHGTFERSTVRLSAGFFALAVVGLTIAAGSFDFPSYFSAQDSRRSQGIACIQEQLMVSDRINCPGIYPGDLTSAYAFSVATNASFVKYVPPSLARFNPSPARMIFDLSQATAASVEILNADVVASYPGGMNLVAQTDVMTIFSAKDASTMRNCQTIMVRASVTGAENEVAELFYRPVGSAHFEQKNSAGAPVNSRTMVEILVSSRSGFENSLRFDPVSRAGPVAMENLAVRCMVFRQ